MGIEKKISKIQKEMEGKKNSSKPPKIKKKRNLVEDKTQIRKWEAARRKRYNDILENLRLELPDNEYKAKVAVLQAAIDYIKECKVFKENILGSNETDEWKREVNRLRCKVKSLKQNNALLLKILKESGLEFETRSKEETIYTMPGACVQSDCVNITRRRIYIDRAIPSIDEDGHQSESADDPSVGEIIHADDLPLSYRRQASPSSSLPGSPLRDNDENETPNQILSTCVPDIDDTILNDVMLESCKSRISSSGNVRITNNSIVNNISKPTFSRKALETSQNLENLNDSICSVSEKNLALVEKKNTANKDLTFILKSTADIRSSPENINNTSISEKRKIESRLGLNFNNAQNHTTKVKVVTNENDFDSRNRITLDETEPIPLSTGSSKLRSPAHVPAPDVNRNSETISRKIDVTSTYQLESERIIGEVQSTTSTNIMSSDLELTNKMPISKEKITAVSTENFSVSKKHSTVRKDITGMKRIYVNNEENQSCQSIAKQMQDSQRKVSHQTTSSFPCINSENQLQKITVAPFEESFVQNLTPIPLINHAEEQITIVSESCSVDEVEEENLTIHAANNIYVASEDGNGTVTVNILESTGVGNEEVHSDPIIETNLKSLHLDVSQQGIAGISGNLSNNQDLDNNIDKNNKNLFLSQDETCIVLQEFPQQQTALQTEIQQNPVHNEISNVNQPNLVTLQVQGNEKAVKKNSQNIVFLQCANTSNTIQLIPPIIENQQLTFVTPSLSNTPIMSTGIPGRMIRMATPNGPQMFFLPPPPPQSFITSITPQPQKLKPIAPKPCACKVSPTKQKDSETFPKLPKNKTLSAKISASHITSKSTSKLKRSIPANLCKSDEPLVKQARKDCEPIMTLAKTNSSSCSLQEKVDSIDNKNILTNNRDVQDEGLKDLSSSTLTGLVQTAAGLMECDEDEPLGSIMDIPEEIPSIAVDSVGIVDPGNVSDDRLVEMLRSIGETENHHFSPPLSPEKNTNRLFKKNDHLGLNEIKDCASTKESSIANNSDSNKVVEKHISTSVKDTDKAINIENFDKSQSKHNSTDKQTASIATVASSSQSTSMDNSQEISSYSITALCSSSRSSQLSKTPYSKPVDYGILNNESKIKTTDNAIVYNISQSNEAVNTSSISLSDNISEISSCTVSTSVVQSHSRISLPDQLKLKQNITDQMNLPQNLPVSIGIPPSIFLGSPVIAATPPPPPPLLTALPTPPPTLTPMPLSLPLPPLSMDHYSASRVSPIISSSTLSHSISNLTTVNSMSPSTLSHTASSAIGSSHSKNPTNISNLSTIFSNISHVPSSRGPPLLPPSHLQSPHAHPHCLSTPSPTFSFSLSMPTNSVSSSSSSILTTSSTTPLSINPISTGFSLKLQTSCLTQSTPSHCIMASKLATNTLSKSAFDHSSVSVPCTNISSNLDKKFADGITESLPIMTTEPMNNIYTESDSVSNTKITPFSTSSNSSTPSLVSKTVSSASDQSFSLQTSSSTYVNNSNVSVASDDKIHDSKDNSTPTNANTASIISSLPSPSISPYPSISCLQTTSSLVFEKSKPKYSICTNSDNNTTTSPVVTNAIFTTRSSDTILSQTLSKSSMQIPSVSSPIYSVTPLSSGLPFKFASSYAATATSQSLPANRILSITTALTTTLPNDTAAPNITPSLCVPISSDLHSIDSLSVRTSGSSASSDAAILAKLTSHSSSSPHALPSTVQAHSSSVPSASTSIPSSSLSTAFPSVPSSSTSPLPLNLWFNSPEKQMHQGSPSKVKYDISKPFYAFSHSPHNASRTVYDSPETPYKISKPFYDPKLAPPTPIKNSTLSHIPVLPLNLKDTEKVNKISSSKKSLVDENTSSESLKVLNESSKVTNKESSYSHGIRKIQEVSKGDKDFVRKDFSVQNETTVPVSKDLDKSKDCKKPLLLKDKASSSMESVIEEKDQRLTASKLSVSNITSTSTPTTEKGQLLSPNNFQTDSALSSKNSNFTHKNETMISKTQAVSKINKNSDAAPVVHAASSSNITQGTTSQIVQSTSGERLTENESASVMSGEVKKTSIHGQNYLTDTVLSVACERAFDYSNTSKSVSVKDSSLNEYKTESMHTETTSSSKNKADSLDRTDFSVSNHDNTSTKQDLQPSDQISKTYSDHTITKSPIASQSRDKELISAKTNFGGQKEETQVEKDGLSQAINIQSPHLSFEKSRNKQENLIHSNVNFEKKDDNDNQSKKYVGKVFDGRLYNSNEEITAKNLVMNEKSSVTKINTNSLKLIEIQSKVISENNSIEGKVTKREKIVEELKGNKEIDKVNDKKNDKQVAIIRNSNTDMIQCSKQQQQQQQQQQGQHHQLQRQQISESGNNLQSGHTYSNKYSPVSSRKHIENVLGSPPNSEYDNHGSQTAQQTKQSLLVGQQHVQHLATDNISPSRTTDMAGLSNVISETSQSQQQSNAYQTNLKQEIQQSNISQHGSIAHSNVPLNQSQISIQKQQQQQISHQHQQRSSQQQHLIGLPTVSHGGHMAAGHSGGTGSGGVVPGELGEGNKNGSGAPQILGSAGPQQVAAGAALGNSIQQNQQNMSYPMVTGGSGYMQTPTYEYNTYNCSPRKSNPHSPRSDNRHQCYGYKQHQYQHSDLLTGDPMMTDEQSHRIQHNAPMPNMNFMEVSDDPVTLRSETSSDPVRYFSVSHLVSHSNETRNSKTSGNQQKESTNSPDEKSNKESPRSKSSNRKSDNSKSRSNTSKSSNIPGDIPTHSRRRSPGRGSQNLNAIGAIPTMWGNKSMVGPSHKQSHNYSTEALLSTQNYGRSVHRPPVPNQNYPIMAHNQMYQTTYTPQQMRNFVPATTFGYSSQDRGGPNQGGGCNTDYNFQLHAAATQPSGHTLPYGAGNMPYMPTGYSPYQNLQCSSSSMLHGEIMMPHTAYPRSLHDFQTDQTNFTTNTAFPLPFEPQDMSGGGSSLMGSGSSMSTKSTPHQHHEHMAHLTVGNVAASTGVPYSRGSNNIRNPINSSSSTSSNSATKRARYGEAATSNMMMSGMGGSSGNILEGGALAHISIHSFTPPCDENTLVHNNLFPATGGVSGARHQSNFLLGPSENMSSIMPGITPPGQHQYSGGGGGGGSSSTTSNSLSSSGTLMAGAAAGGSTHVTTLAAANLSGGGPGTQRSGHGAAMVTGSSTAPPAPPPPGHMTFSPLPSARMMHDRQQMTTALTGAAPSAPPHLSSSLSNFNLTSIIPDIDSKGGSNSVGMRSSGASSGGVTSNETITGLQDVSMNSQNSRVPIGPPPLPASIIPSITTTDPIKAVPPEGPNRLTDATANNHMNNIFTHTAPHQASLSLNSSLPLPPTSFTGINFNPSDH